MRQESAINGCYFAAGSDAADCWSMQEDDARSTDASKVCVSWQHAAIASITVNVACVVPC